MAGDKSMSIASDNATQAEIFSLVAKMNSILATIEGMKAFNKYREMQEFSPGYDESSFLGAEIELRKISEELMEISKR